MFKKYNCIRQEGLRDCGVCSLLTIVEFYGGGVSIEYLRELTNTTKMGTNAFYLLEAGKRLGFSTKALKGDVLDLDKSLLPCIAHVVIDNSYKHFVVIHKIDKKKKKIVVADPNKGIITYKYDDYKEISTDNYLVFIPNKKIPTIQKNRKIYLSIYDFFIKYKYIFLSIFFFSLLYTIVSIILSFQYQLIIDTVITYHSKNNLYFIISLIAILSIIKLLTDWLRNFLLNYINHKLDFSLMKDTFKQVISLPYLYYKNRTTGETISRISDLTEIKEVLSQIFMTVFVDIILIIFVLVTLIKINFNLTLIGISMGLIYILIIKLFNPKLKNYIAKNKEEASLVNSYLVEAINNVDTIKSLGLEEQTIDELSIKYVNYLESSYIFNKIYNNENLLKDIIYYLGIVVITFLGTISVLNNQMTIGELITYNSLIIYFLEPVKNIINIELLIQRTKRCLIRITELFEIKCEELGFDEKYTNNSISGDIKIINLAYSYDGRNNALNSINLNVSKGEKILIYGESGSGKSTLGKILMKYFDVPRGNVLIDNKDICDYNTLELRNNICYISQNENLFTDTIYNNIVLRKDISYDDFLTVSKITRTEDIIINNPLSYHFLLEENGFNISGGERQRIILARSLLKRSNIYIFDESLSQIDIEREREILKNIFTHYKDKTFIVISHRFNNEDLFDKKINVTKGFKNA